MSASWSRGLPAFSIGKNARPAAALLAAQDLLSQAKLLLVAAMVARRRAVGAVS
jgi:hypothetical protein